MTDEDLMPYGMYEGTKMANVPAEYLLYMYDEGKCTAEVKAYVEDNYDLLKEEADG